RPRDVPSGVNQMAFARYQSGQGGGFDVRTRPRMIYTLSAGYLHGFSGGDYSATPPPAVNGVRLSSGYNDAIGTSACQEIFRYMPDWVSSAPNYTLNNLIPQP